MKCFAVMQRANLSSGGICSGYDHQEISKQVGLTSADSFEDANLPSRENNAICEL